MGYLVRIIRGSLKNNDSSHACVTSGAPTLHVCGPLNWDQENANALISLLVSIA